MTHNPTSLQGRIEEYLAQRQYYNAIPMIDDLIERVNELEGKLEAHGLSCDDEGCPHYGTKHSHPRLSEKPKGE